MRLPTITERLLILLPEGDRMKNSEYKFSNTLPQKQIELLLGTCDWPS